MPHKQRIATMQTIENEGITTDCIEIMSLSEESVGILIAYFELLTSCVGNIFEINTYDQPGVEFGKARLKNSLKHKVELCKILYNLRNL